MFYLINMAVFNRHYIELNYVFRTISFFFQIHCRYFSETYNSYQPSLVPSKGNGTWLFEVVFSQYNDPLAIKKQHLIFSLPHPFSFVLF